MSDTIILYENGKAVGGEGHPTNADEITFDNTGTDLVSEEVESAIKEVNAKFDRGSVSVTANGSKTYKVLLEELFASADLTKISNKAHIEIARPTGQTPLYHLQHKGVQLIFTNSEVVTSGYITSFTYVLSTVTAKYETLTLTAPSTISRADNSGNVPASGETFTLYY